MELGIIGVTQNQTWRFEVAIEVCGFFFFFFGQFPGLSGIKEPGPLKSFVLIVWWTRLGSPQLYWVDYKPSSAQNMDPTTHTYSYMQIYIYIYILQKQTAKEQ